MIPKSLIPKDGLSVNRLVAIFGYGTLRREFDHDTPVTKNELARQPGTIRGTMYEFTYERQGPFVGVVPHGDGRVIGDAIVCRNAQVVLRYLDWRERIEEKIHCRAPVEVTLSDGRNIWAIAYLLIADAGRGDVVPSGDYLDVPGHESFLKKNRALLEG